MLVRRSETGNILHVGNLDLTQLRHKRFRMIDDMMRAELGTSHEFLDATPWQ